MGRGWNLFKSKAVNLKVHRNTETVILGFPCFSPYPCEILETQEIFHRNYFVHKTMYGMATISRLLKIIGLFCKRALSKR